MIQNTQRARTGVAGLDEVLRGGLLPQRLYLIDGNPGAGKTTVALQFLLEGVRLAEKCTYITLSETKEELETGARSHGWSLDGIEIIELIAEDAEFLTEGQLTMLPPSEVDLSETTRKVLEAIERSAPSRLVLDSLSEYRLLAQSSLRYRRQILALKHFFVGRRCTVLLIDDRTGEGPDMQLHSITHGVIALYSRAPAYGQIHREVQILKFRGSDFISGYHDFVIRRGGLTVFPRLVAAQHTSKFPAQSILSGVAELDTLMGGGIDRGTATLFVGPPGSGKSTIAFQYATAAAKRGDHAAAFVFDEAKSALLARTAGLGIEIKEGSGAGEIAIHQVDPIAISPGEFAHMVISSVERDHASVVIIDSLNGYLNTMPQNNFLTAQLHDLLSYLNNQGVATCLTVAQSGMIGASMSSPVDASYLADSVVLLRYFELAGTVRKAISVLKKRTGGHEGSIRELRFDEFGIHLSAPLLQLRGVLTGIPTETGSAGTPEHDTPSRGHVS